MSDQEILQAYTEQNRRDQISNSKLATILSIILNMFCSVMDYFAYPNHFWLFFKMRVACCLAVALVWVFFLTPIGRSHHRIFGVGWYMFPMLMIQLMIYLADDPYSPYYAGLNIILLAVGLLSPWTHKQNFASAFSVLVLYGVVCYSMKTTQPLGWMIGNTTFLILTAVIVVAGSTANARQRWREFELRWELDRSRKAVEESNRRLTELDQAKSRLFANISHELRTPLTLLIAPLENLLHRLEGGLDPDTRQLLLVMRANAMRLLKLINDLLDLVRLDSGVMQVKREPVALSDFLRGLASAARQLAEDRQLRLESEVAADVGRVMIDRDKLEKVILNLQFNALKFTPSGGQVKLQAVKEGELLVIRVSDTGMGIAERDLPNVFNRFWQADNSSQRKFQGVGIGLALVKELTEVQGGKVSVQSQEGQGTTFTVSLPYLEAEKEAITEGAAPITSNIPSTPAEGGAAVSNQEWLSNLYRRAELFPAMNRAQQSAASGKAGETIDRKKLSRVLVADDEPDMLQFLKSQLQSLHQVVEAVDGVQAVEKAGQTLPDLILLDMMMPHKDGLQACREIRQRMLTKSIPIIMLTARADEETKLAALSAGASDFLAKPFSTTELHVRIKNLLESHFYQTRLARQNRALEDALDQLKAAQSQLVQSEKLASLGRLSAGIIHEVNNPLNFATTGLYTLRNKARYLAEDQRADYAEILRDIEDGLSRVRTIISDLRTFSHPGEAPPDEVRLDEVVGVALRFTSNLWKDKVEIVQSLGANPVVRANKNRLVQVLVNLMQNSVDALRRKQFQAPERPTIWMESQVVDGQTRLLIRDNGEGIAPENLDKVFDPFFTTKDVGEGMGLGLSICYSIVQEYGGQIRVRSERGKFCEFALEFPVQTPHSGNGKSVLAA
jgi:signal transduction histidine kinase